MSRELLKEIESELRSAIGSDEPRARMLAIAKKIGDELAKPLPDPVAYMLENYAGQRGLCFDKGQADEWSNIWDGGTITSLYAELPAHGKKIRVFAQQDEHSTTATTYAAYANATLIIDEGVEL